MSTPDAIYRNDTMKSSIALPWTFLTILLLVTFASTQGKSIAILWSFICTWNGNLHTIPDNRCFLIGGGSAETFFVSENATVGSVIGNNYTCYKHKKPSWITKKTFSLICSWHFLKTKNALKVFYGLRAIPVPMATSHYAWRPTKRSSPLTRTRKISRSLKLWTKR